jgi:predicted nucleic acid-binding protein
MGGDVFADTNVLVYSRDTTEPDKCRQARAWMTHLWTTRTGRLSSQVLQEFYVTVTEKLNPRLDRESARREVRSLAAWRPVPIDGRVLEAAWQMQDRHRLSWWDALIAAAARIGGCTYLLTEDLQDDQLLDTIRIVNPFRVSPQLLNQLNQR